MTLRVVYPHSSQTCGGMHLHFPFVIFTINGFAGSREALRRSGAEPGSQKACDPISGNSAPLVAVSAVMAPPPTHRPKWL